MQDIRLGLPGTDLLKLPVTPYGCMWTRCMFPAASLDRNQHFAAKTCHSQHHQRTPLHTPPQMSTMRSIPLSVCVCVLDLIFTETKGINSTFNSRDLKHEDWWYFRLECEGFRGGSRCRTRSNTSSSSNQSVQAVTLRTDARARWATMQIDKCWSLVMVNNWTHCDLCAVTWPLSRSHWVKHITSTKYCNRLQRLHNLKWCEFYI